VKGMMQSEEAILEKLKIEFLQKEKQIRLEVRNAYKEVANAKENMDIQEKMLTLSRKTLERMEAIMETPVISQKYPHLAGITFDDVLRAREDYADAQTTYFAQKRNYMEARENLRQKMGIIE
jgi:outer membrane protein TolC